MLKRKHSGFTLIGVMIVVAIVGILAAIAYPSYVDQVRKARRTDAKNALLEMAARQERFYSENNSYGDLAALGYANPAPSPEGWYQLTATQIGGGGLPTTANITAGTRAQSYVLTAMPPTGTDQASDTDCGNFTLNSLGVQGVSGSDPGGRCW